MESSKWRLLSSWNMKIPLGSFSTHYFRILFLDSWKKSVARVYPGIPRPQTTFWGSSYPGIPGPQNVLKKSAHKVTKICAKKELNDIYMFWKGKKHHFEFLNRISSSYFRIRLLYIDKPLLAKSWVNKFQHHYDFKIDFSIPNLRRFMSK